MTAGCKATHKCNDFAFLSTMFSEYDFFLTSSLKKTKHYNSLINNIL